jgi:hypothetical protein
MKHNSKLLAALLLAGSLFLLEARPAQALPYDGTDPATTGCSASARTPYYRVFADFIGQYLGEIQLRFSSSCQTAWARLVFPGKGTVGCPYLGEGVACGEVEVHRKNDGSWMDCYVGNGDTGCYTRQLWDQGSYQSYAAGGLLDLGDMDAGWQWDSTEAY